MHGPVLPRRLDPAASGHVVGHAAHLAEAALVVALGPQGHLDVDRVAVPTPHDQLAGPGVLGLDLVEDLGLEAAQGLGGEEGLQGRLADLGVAEEVLGRPVEEPDPAVGGDAEHGVAVRLDAGRASGSRRRRRPGSRRRRRRGSRRARPTGRRRPGRRRPGAGRGADRRRRHGTGTTSGPAHGRTRPPGGPRSTRSPSGPASSGRDRPRAVVERQAGELADARVGPDEAQVLVGQEHADRDPVEEIGEGGACGHRHVVLCGAGQPFLPVRSVLPSIGRWPVRVKWRRSVGLLLST